MPFIVLEGLDGAGKSTQINKLRRLIESRGHVCRYIHFPRFDAPVYGELIARFLRGELGAVDQVDPYLVALLYAGDRADAAETIRGWLAQGDWVIADRYVYSNIGYQCAKVADPERRKALADWILAVEFGTWNIPQPDITLFLDVPFAFTERKLAQHRTGEDRSYLQGADDIHESSLDLQRRVREVYTAAAENGELHAVDCSDGAGGMESPETIFGRITKVLARIPGLD